MTLKEFNFSFDERGEIPAYYRHKIYKEINKFSASKTLDNGHYLRAKLEIMCARKVLVNWEYCELTNNSARKLLDIAEKFLHSQADKK